MAIPHRSTSHFVLSLALTIGVAAPALADPPIVPATCQAKGARRATSGEFHFTAEQLKKYRRARKHIVEVCPLERARFAARPKSQQSAKLSQPVKADIHPPHCGIVDDWHYAAMKAQSYCESLGMGPSYFVASSPAAFNAADHHAAYNADMGLTGSCYFCPTSATATTAAATAATAKKNVEIAVPEKAAPADKDK